MLQEVGTAVYQQAQQAAQAQQQGAAGQAGPTGPQAGEPQSPPPSDEEKVVDSKDYEVKK